MPDGHPARRCVSTHLERPVSSPFGLYVRVPDLPAFLRTVAPTLEARVEASPAIGLCGNLTLDLFTERLEVRFDAGRLVGVDA